MGCRVMYRMCDSMLVFLHTGTGIILRSLASHLHCIQLDVWLLGAVPSPVTESTPPHGIRSVTHVREIRLDASIPGAGRFIRPLVSIDCPDTSL